MIFLSYSHKDQAIVAPIAETFRKVFGEKGVFFDQWSIQPGDSIIDKMMDGLVNCRYFFYFVSKSSISSQMVGLEWKNALVKNVKGSNAFIPVKLDDCDMPGILLQNLYINLYGYGMEVALRQMVDIASGKNTYRPETVSGFQNIRAYVSGTDREVTIEFRAEAFTEPHSKYMVLIENTEDELSCALVSSPSMFMMGFQKDVCLSSGEKFNAFQISRSEATSPRFPFVIKLSASGVRPVSLRFAMRADSADSFVGVPLIDNRSMQS